jgi:hypothetical protein
MLSAVFYRLRLRLWKRRYRPGAVVRHFLAPDIQREVEIVDVSQIESGRIAARTRTWNVLYAIRGMAAQPEFGPVRMIAIKDLWKWSGEPWGGPVPEPEDLGDST